MIEIRERSKIFSEVQKIYKKITNIILKYGIYKFFCLFAYLLSYVLL